MDQLPPPIVTVGDDLKRHTHASHHKHTLSRTTVNYEETRSALDGCVVCLCFRCSGWGKVRKILRQDGQNFGCVEREEQELCLRLPDLCESQFLLKIRQNREDFEEKRSEHQRIGCDLSRLPSLHGASGSG